MNQKTNGIEKQKKNFLYKKQLLRIFWRFAQCVFWVVLLKTICCWLKDKNLPYTMLAIKRIPSRKYKLCLSTLRKLDIENIPHLKDFSKNGRLELDATNIDANSSNKTGINGGDTYKYFDATKYLFHIDRQKVLHRNVWMSDEHC